MPAHHAVLHQQYLRRFMTYLQALRDRVRHWPLPPDIDDEDVGIDRGAVEQIGHLGRRHRAEAARRAVLEEQHRRLGRAGDRGVELLEALERRDRVGRVMRHDRKILQDWRPTPWLRLVSRSLSKELR